MHPAEDAGVLLEGKSLEAMLESLEATTLEEGKSLEAMLLEGKTLEAALLV